MPQFNQGANPLTAKEQAIIALEDVQTRFPHPRLEAWINEVKANRADYWRNAGLVLIAIGKHSRNQTTFDHNRSLVEKIMAGAKVMWQW